MSKTKSARGLRRWLALTATASALVFALPFAASAAEPVPYAWAPVPWGGAGYVDGFVYHPKVQGVLYARTDIGGMYRFDYASKSWVALLDHINHDDADLMGVLSIAVDPNDASKVYAATGLYMPDWARKGAIMRSSDQGRTWQKTDLPIHVGGNTDGRGTGDRLVIDPKDGNVLYYGSNQDGLWKSRDAGKSFGKVASPGSSLSLVIVDPAAPQTVYVGAFDGKGGLFVSQDGGGSFKAVDGTPNQVPQHAAFGPDGALYVTFAAGDGKNAVNPSYATRGGVWRRDPQSGKWNNISPIRVEGDMSFGYSGVDISPDGTLVVSTIDRWSPGDDVFVSKDAGKTWMALGDKSQHDAAPYPWLVTYLRGEEKMGHWISDVKINPFNGDEMIYGTGYGLWMSRNLKAAGTEPLRFDFNVTSLEEGAIMQMTSPTGGATLLVAMGDVGGAAWDDITKTPSLGLFKPTTDTNFSIDYAGLAPNFLARVANNLDTQGFYSEDLGNSWTPFATTPYERPTAKAEWRSPGVIAVSAKAGSMVWVPEKAGAFYSNDKGKTWKASTGWPTGRDQTLVPVSDKTIEGVYYVLDRFNAAILISVDGGVSFKPIVQGLPKLEGWQGAQLAAVPTRTRDLWLAEPSGLYHSRDANAQMKAIPGVDTAWLVSFGASATKDSYPAVYLWGKVKGKEGLWRSDDEGKTWLRINDDAHQFGGFQAISGDPLEFGTLYVAPHGRGVLVGKPGK